MELDAGFVCVCVGGSVLNLSRQYVISSTDGIGILNASSSMTTFITQTYMIHRILQYVMLMWLYTHSLTHSLQSVKRVWRYEDLLHEEGRDRNNTRRQFVKVSFVQMGWRIGFNIKCQPVATEEVNEELRLIIWWSSISVNFSPWRKWIFTDCHQGSANMLIWKIKYKPAGPAWPKMTRGIRQPWIHGGRIWSMFVSLDKPSLFFSSQVDFGSHLVWPPPNSFPE